MLVSLDISVVEDDDKETSCMKQWWQLRLVAVLGLLSLLPCAAADAQQPKSTGQVTALEGKVTVLHQGKFTPEPLTLQKPVFQEDIIETDRASKVRITLADATVISLGEQSRLELKQFSHDASQQTRSGRLAIAWGFFRAILKEMTSSSTVEVITPTAVAAIRGTDLMGEVTADSTAIVVLEGTVAISNIRPMFRGLSTLTPGMGTTVKGDEPPSTPTRWSEPRIEGLRRATALQ
jgi:FecR protein